MQDQCWFYCYPEKFLADTLHLSTHDTGAYLLGLMWYYVNGPLPNDDVVLQRIMRVAPADWARCKGQVMGFFFQNGDGLWHQKRADLEIARRNGVIQRNYERTRKALESRGLTSHFTPHVTSHVGGPQQITWREELNRVMEKMSVIERTYSAHQNWRAADKAEHKRLRERRNELREKLGVKV